MAKYEFFGTGCGSGTSYTVIKDGVGWGNQQPQCPDVNLYFKNYYPNDEVWVNGVLVSNPTVTHKTCFGGYCYTAQGAGADECQVVSQPCNGTAPPPPPEPPGTTTTKKSNGILKALAAASALVAGAVLLKRR